MEETKIENEAVTGELLPADEHEDLAVNKSSGIAVAVLPEPTSSNQRFFLRYIALPFSFITVALLGGLRLNGADSSLIFLKPPLLCLIFSAIMLALFFRAGLIRMDGWFSEEFSMLKNLANGAVLAALFAATAQLFNSLLPEQGLPFWVVGFCFFWTLWNNLFAEFDTKKLLRSLGGLFGLAFVVKYLVLANLTAPASDSWLRSIFENPGKEAFTWALDLPRFSAGTGYIQFFAITFYLLGLFLLPASTRDSDHHYEI
ncbi:MAG: hypothetical protein ABI481_03460 [Pyrinomonadaceae bacterium]